MKKNSNSFAYKLFHPFWKLFIAGPPFLYGWFALIRDEFLPEKIKRYLSLGKIFNDIAWYLWVIAGLIFYIILKINREIKSENQIINIKPVLSGAQIFPGIWKNTWTFNEGISSQKFKIVNDNEYHIFNEMQNKWEYIFYLDDLREENGEIKFVKLCAQENFKPHNFNKLKRIGANEFEGEESNNTHVKYTRLE